MISAQHLEILSTAEFCDERVHLLPSFPVAASAMPEGGGADRIGDERIGSSRGGARDVMGRQPAHGREHPLGSKHPFPPLSQRRSHHAHLLSLQFLQATPGQGSQLQRHQCVDCERGLHQQNLHLLWNNSQQVGWKQNIRLSVLFVKRRSRRQWRAKHLSSQRC